MRAVLLAILVGLIGLGAWSKLRSVATPPPAPPVAMAPAPAPPASSTPRTSSPEPFVPAYADAPIPSTAAPQAPAPVPTPVPTAAPTGPRPEVITISDFASRIKRTSGQPSIIVLYGPRCPISQRVFPQLSAIARQWQPAGVDFQVYSTDDDEDMGEVIPFLAQHNAPFKAIHIKKWETGELIAALGQLGVPVKSPWTRPLVVIRHADGRVAAHAQGVGDLTALEQALASGALITSR